MSVLVLKNVQKVYPNGYKAIHGIDITIQEGEFIVIVGPSGCGKSTFMRMIAGLEEVSSGEIIIDNKVVNKLEPSQRNISMVFQNYALYPHMTIYDNMAYGLKIAKLPKIEINNRVLEIATMLGLEELLERKPKQLSGGQRQRVAMGRAIARQPKVFLFDEPLSNLDAKLRVQMRLEIQKLHHKLKITSLYVTHDQVEAMTLADRIIVLNNGKVEQIGTPKEIFNYPASYFVADFMGSPPMNLIAVQFNKQAILEDSEQTLPLDLTNLDVRLFNQPVYLGIRPEHLVFHPQGLAMSIEMIETLGSEYLIHLCYNQQRFVMRTPIEDLLKELKLNDVITVWAKDSRNISWFSQETGQAII